jgi:hypothetical protein
VDYCLSPEHPEGVNKARVFASALAIFQADWEYLRDQFLEQVPQAPVIGILPDVWGTRYEVRIFVDGLNGSTHPVTTVWFIEDDEPPRLCSAYVDVP